MATKLQIRRDTAANWTSANPTLSAGEFGFETDTYKLKIGDGSTAWTSLDYYADQLVSTGGLDSASIISLLGNGSVQHIIPAGNELYDLGDSANRFRDLYLSGSTLNLGGVTLSVDSGGTLTLPEGTRVGSIRVLDSADVATIAGSISGLDSTGVSNLIDAAYIQSRQITYNTNDFADSAFVTSQINNLIDGAPGTLDTLNEIAAALNDDAAAYDTLLSLINAKTDYDSADTLSLIDSAYIQARQTTASSGLDSASVTNLIDSAYVQARQTSGGGGLDSASITNLIDSDYIQLRRPAETIMTVTGDGANYYFVGDGFPSTSSGDPTLYLTRGKTYRFENIPGSHPFEIRQSSGGSAYSTGVTNNGGSGTVIFTVPMDAPTSLVYQCTVHSGMVGDIVILDNTTGGGGLDSAGVTNLIDSAYIQARQTAGGSGGLDSAATISLINNNTNSGFFKYKYTATSGQTVFADSDANGNVMSFDPNSTLVFYNGVLLDETTDYEASSNTVTLTSGADAGVSITVAKYGVGYVDTGPSYLGNRGIYAGGNDGSARVNPIDYFDITTLGNASDFGDMLTPIAYMAGNISDKTYGVFAGGYTDTTAGIVDIQYITIPSAGNSTDFGDLQGTAWLNVGLSDDTRGVITRNFQVDMDYIAIATPGNAATFGTMATQVNYRAPASDGTYGLFAGGTGYVNNIDYITIQTTSNTSDFGDLTNAREGTAGASSETYGVFAGGVSNSNVYEDTIDYVTIATPSNATDFGDLVVGRHKGGGTSNGTRGVFISGYDGSVRLDSIEYVTIDTPSNALDFGDLTVGRDNGAGTSGNAA